MHTLDHEEIVELLGSLEFEDSFIKDVKEKRLNGSQIIYTFAYLKASTGGEEHDLWNIREHNKEDFDSFVVMTLLSPHASIGVSRLTEGNHLDEIIFGVDEATQKTPFNWFIFIFFPGYIALRYALFFTDTNFWLASSMAILFLLYDLLLSCLPLVLFLATVLPLVAAHLFIDIPIYLYQVKKNTI